MEEHYCGTIAYYVVAGWLDFTYLKKRYLSYWQGIPSRPSLPKLRIVLTRRIYSATSSPFNRARSDFRTREYDSGQQV